MDSRVTNRTFLPGRQDLLAEAAGILKLHNLHKRIATESDVTDCRTKGYG